MSKKKKIAILGSTGSIGKSLINIIKKDEKNFEIVLLSAKANYKELLKQAKYFKVKNLIITNKDSYLKIKKDKNIKNIRIYKDFNNFKKIFKKKIDYTMSSIVGLEGLNPTFKIIKHTKKIAIANKESLICGWHLINKELKKYNTKFIPVDSEHFSIWFGLNNNYSEVDKILLTASGGPFLNLPINKFKKIKISQAIKHPNWKMGKKISVDSATMMNKVYEVIEAKNIFNLDNYSKLSIITHPSSYIHAVIKFKNGLIKIIAHDTNMKIPIFNTIYENVKKNKLQTKNIDVRKLNSLNFNKVDSNKFPIIKILKMLPKKNSLFETIVVSANDELVNKFLNNKISFIDISKKLLNFVKDKKFNKYKTKYPKNINEIVKLNKYVRFKINSKSI